MLDRFANVIYWFGSGLAGLCGLAAVMAAWVKANDYILFWLIFGVLFWLAGRAVRYVLSGR